MTASTDDNGDATQAPADHDFCDDCCNADVYGDVRDDVHDDARSPPTLHTADDCLPAVDHGDAPDRARCPHLPPTSTLSADSYCGDATMAPAAPASRRRLTPHCVRALTDTSGSRRSHGRNFRRFFIQTMKVTRKSDNDKMSD